MTRESRLLDAIQVLSVSSAPTYQEQKKLGRRGRTVPTRISLRGSLIPNPGPCPQGTCLAASTARGIFLPMRKFVPTRNRASDLEWVCHRAGLATWPPNLRQRIKSREIYFYLSLKFFCSNVLWPTLKIKIRGSLVFF